MLFMIWSDLAPFLADHNGNLPTRPACTLFAAVFDVGLFRRRDPCRGDARPSPRLVGWFSGDFDFDLLRLCFLALGQMDL